jgi:hypothetical protein
MRVANVAVMSENRIFVMDTADVLASCGIALADSETAKEMPKLPAVPGDEPRAFGNAGPPAPTSTTE